MHSLTDIIRMKTLLVLIVLLVKGSIPVSGASTGHAPRQQHDVRHSHSSTTPVTTTTSTSILAAVIHVLPSSPDDRPVECRVNSTLDAPCGAERYCVPGHQERTNTTPAPTLYCRHKTLWSPTLTAADMFAFLLAGVCCFLAAMAGIGGGGLILPILLLCSNFTPKEAAVLSNTAVFCNTLGQFGINHCHVHDSNNNNSNSNNNNHWALVLATVLIIMPFLIAGGSVAITLEGMVPSTVILILAFLTLTLATTKTYHKANKMRWAEQQQQQQQQYDRPPTPSMSIATPPPSSRMNLASVQEGEENGQGTHDPAALMALALEWGSVLAGDIGNPSSPTSSPRRARFPESPLLENGDIVEESFLGSIRYLSKDDNSDVLIIDETSLSPSSQLSDIIARDDNSASDEQSDFANDDDQNNEAVAADGHAEHHNNETAETVAGVVRSFVTQNKLQLLIGGFWILDATTFLLLHTGTMVAKKCSPVFFLLVGFPALVATVFVALGRRHLLAMQRQDTVATTTTTTTTVTEEHRPLMMMTNYGEDEEQGDEGEAVELVPTLVAMPDNAGQPQAQLSSLSTTRTTSSNEPQPLHWVPLLSVLAVVMTTLRLSDCASPQHLRQGSPTLSLQGSIRRPLLLSASSSMEEGEGDSLNGHAMDGHDNFKSLLAWWLPWASMVIGLLSALLGIGGGELLGPILLLLLQMDPQQSSATTAIMSVMNSGTNLLHHIVADMMIAPGYAFHLGFVGFVGGCMGRLWAISLAQKGRPSIIALSLCGVLGLATALVAWELVTTPVSFKSRAGIC
jgi:uncharacterized membrane protein YfcA